MNPYDIANVMSSIATSSVIIKQYFFDGMKSYLEKPSVIHTRLLLGWCNPNPVFIALFVLINFANLGPNPKFIRTIPNIGNMQSPYPNPADKSTATTSKFYKSFPLTFGFCSIRDFGDPAVKIGFQ